MKIFQSLSDLLSKEKYDLIVCDIFGVLHDGVKSYPQAMEALQSLSSIRQPVVLLSNSTRLDYVLSEDLKKRFGIAPSGYDSILSSGMLTRYFLCDCADFLTKQDLPEERCQASVRPGTTFMGPKEFTSRYIKTGKFFMVGDPICHEPAYHDVQGRIDRTLDLREMDFCFLGAVRNTSGLEGVVDPYDEQSVRSYIQPLLDFCLERKVPMICANPDVVAPCGIKEDGSQRLMICPGYIGEMYETMGGTVLYFGKPFQSIYHYLLHNAGKGRRVLCIGDNVATDVLGAKQVDLDVLMILGGVHASELSNLNEEELKAKVRQLCEKFGALEPTYLMPMLTFKST